MSSNFTKNEQKAMLEASDTLVRDWMDICAENSTCNHEYTFNVNVYFLAAQAYVALVHKMGEELGEEPVSLAEMDCDPNNERN